MKMDKPAVEVRVTLPRSGDHEAAIEAFAKGLAALRGVQSYMTDSQYGSQYKASYFTLDIEYATDGGPTMADLRAALEEVAPTDSGT